MILVDAKPAHLILQNGRVFEGKSFGAEGTSVGEVVFTTTMTGYQEVLTDLSFHGQIVTQTYPLIGNYGVNIVDYESHKAAVSGYIVREWCENPSNFRCENTIDEFLKKFNIIGLFDIDTRALTRIIRESGVLNGVITTDYTEERKDEFVKMAEEFMIVGAVASVTCDKVRFHKAENEKFKVALLDYGYKRNILNKLLSFGISVYVCPAYFTAKDLAEYDIHGIMLSNGPGDPAENKEIIENLKEIRAMGLPIFGICLGHQLLALSNGFKTHKLKYGHRGGNQPVTDIEKKRTYITSQNHGYAVTPESVDSGIATISHINANDKSCEGIKYKNERAFTVQFHPEASAGPHDTGYLFLEFLSAMEENNA